MNTRSRSLTALRVAAAAAPLALASLTAMALPAAAFNDADDPRGNNGTVKVTQPVDEGNPYAACSFDIEWYGFDEGADIISTVELTRQSESGGDGATVVGPTEVFVGGDRASGAGTADSFDGEATYTVLTFDPAPQGYHLKVTVHVPGSQGADTKHKVLWVTPCYTPPPPPPNF